LKKITVLVDLYYLKAAVAGIGSYIRELEASCKDHGSDHIKYIFTHDINKLVGNSIFLNSNNKIIRWIFQIRYLIYKQIQLPLKILFLKRIMLFVQIILLLILHSKLKELRIA
jgi:hypothetical protein